MSAIEPYDGTTRRNLVLIDLDGTITTRDTYLAYLLGYFLRHPRRWLKSPRLLWAVLLYKAGRRDNSWLKEVFLGHVLGCASRDEIRSWNARFIPWIIERGLRPGARSEIERRKANAERIVLLTASPDLYVHDLAARLGIDEVLCTRVEWFGQYLSGRLASANVYGDEKLRLVSEWLGETSEATHVIAYADHRSDLPLLCWADTGIVVCPGRGLRRRLVELGLESVSW